MSEHDLDQLDQRARTASDDLRQRAAARPAPTFDPSHAVLGELPATRSRTQRRAYRVLAIAAVLLVVAAIAGVLATRSDHDQDPADVVTTDPRPFVAGSLPNDFRIIGAGEVTADDMASSGAQSAIAGPVQIYGPSVDDPQLGVARYPAWDPDSDSSERPDPIEANGRKLYAFDDLGLGAHALVVEDGDEALLLVSKEMSSEWLQALGGDVTVADDGSVDLHGFQLPEDWEQLGQVPDLLALGNPLYAMNSNPGVGKYAMYQRGGYSSVSGAESGSGDDEETTTTTTEPQGPSEDYGTLFVSSSPGSDFELHAGSLVADDTTTTEVRGHRALLRTSAAISDELPGPTRSLSWIERPGELVTVTGMGVSEQELRDVAEGLESPTAGDWKMLLEQAQLGELDPANDDDAPKTVIGEGRFDDGSKWVLAYRTTDVGGEQSLDVDLAVAVRGGGGDSSTSSTSGNGSAIGDDTAILATQVEDREDRSFGAALVSDAVARVQLVDEDGKVLAEPEIVTGGGRRGVAVEVPEGAAFLVAFDDQGKELGRSPFFRTTIDINEGSSSVSGSNGETETTVVDDGSGSSSGSGSGGN